MKNLSLVVTAIAAIVGMSTDYAGACALHLPSFELTGFPISRHQVAVLGAVQVEESAVMPTLMFAGMPASPHQIAVLTPRSKTAKIVEASAGITPKLAPVGLTRPGSERSTGRASCASE